jgi:hypothetical protein
MARRVITLLGDPIVTEDGEATEAIKPGHLIQGVTAIALLASGGEQPVRVALERDELGKGIDDVVGSGTATATSVYASGDTVKVGAFGGGMRWYGWLGSGESVSAGALLESNADGTLKAGTTNPIAMALETVDASAADTRIRAEVMV